MNEPPIVTPPRCPKCDSDRVEFKEVGSPRGKKALCFYIFAVCYLVATLVAMSVEFKLFPADSPDWLKAMVQYLGDSGLGRFILLSAVGLVVFAYVCLEGHVDALSGVAKLLSSPERRCRLCGYSWPASE